MLTQGTSHNVLSGICPNAKCVFLCFSSQNPSISHSLSGSEDEVLPCIILFRINFLQQSRSASLCTPRCGFDRIYDNRSSEMRPLPESSIALLKWSEMYPHQDPMRTGRLAASVRVCVRYCISRHEPISLACTML